MDVNESDWVVSKLHEPYALEVSLKETASWLSTNQTKE